MLSQALVTIPAVFTTLPPAVETILSWEALLAIQALPAVVCPAAAAVAPAEDCSNTKVATADPAVEVNMAICPVWVSTVLAAITTSTDLWETPL
jgi:hypothetical protein